MKHVELDKEQHRKQGEVEDIGGERLWNHHNPEDPEKWGIQHSHSWQKKTVKSQKF